MEQLFAIREARLRDVEEIYGILEKADWVDKEDIDWLEAFLSVKSRRRLTLVAVDTGSGRIAGFLSAYKVGRLAYIDTIAVHYDYRGRGAGSLLLEEAEKRLKNRGADRVTLSVKKENTRALDFYLRRGYQISNVVLVLKARPSELSCEEGEEALAVKEVSPARIRSKTLRRATAWSYLVEPVDRLVYKKAYRKGRAVAVLKRGRIKGFAEYSLDSSLVVDNIAVSSYSEKGLLQALLCGLARIAINAGANSLKIYVDSTKTTFARDLEEFGFRVEDAEFFLEKEL